MEKTLYTVCLIVVVFLLKREIAYTIESYYADRGRYADAMRCLLMAPEEQKPPECYIF